MNDFSKGKISQNIIAQAIPLMMAQLVHLLYNVVDRVYIGHMPDVGSMALTGIGLSFPIITLTAAFTNMFSTGGAPLFAIRRGAKNEDRAEKILSHVVSLIVIMSVVVMVIGTLFRKPILYLFGASDVTYPYADSYLKIYLFGTTFSMLSTGLNPFINAQGFPKIGMGTVVLGAVMNLILDPIFIFGLKMGVSGAALATIISQMVSCLWVLSFFKGKKTMYRFRKEYMKPELPLTKEICSLGLTGFIMQATNTLVSVLCNVTLRNFGGDIYVSVMTVLNSIRELLTMPGMSLTSGARPVISYNYGARKYTRVREGIKFSTSVATAILLAMWIVVIMFPSQLVRIFSDDELLVTTGVHCLKIFFMGFGFMALQAGGQSAFTAMKCTKRAIFFSLLRKLFIVAPLTVILPRVGFGVDGVFYAEMISNVVGGTLCFITMYFTLYRRLPKTDGVDFVR